MKVSKTSRRRQADRAVPPKPAADARLLPAALAAVVLPGAAALDEEDARQRAFRQLNLAEQALLDARSKLRAIQQDSNDAAEQADAAAGLLAIERDLALLDARRLALEASAATLKPPSDADIAEAQRIAAELAKPIAASARAAAIAGLAADIVKLTEQLTG